MLCAKCGEPIRSGLLGCSNCLHRTSLREYRKRQVALLWKVIADDSDLVTVYDLAGVRHLLMFDAPVDITFCGAAAAQRRGKLHQMDFDTAHLCPNCRQQFQALARESQETRW